MALRVRGMLDSMISHELLHQGTHDAMSLCLIDLSTHRFKPPLAGSLLAEGTGGDRQCTGALSAPRIGQRERRAPG